MTIVRDEESGKSIRIGEYEGMPYLWILRPSGTGWSIRVPSSVFRDGVQNGTFMGESDEGKERRLTVHAGPQTTKIHIHHPEGRSGGDITVDSLEFDDAIASEYMR